MSDYSLTHTLVFLFSGKAGTGKTFSSDIANDTCRKMEIKGISEHYATGVKQIAKHMGWDGVKDAKGRKLLQSIGQIGRSYDENMWVRSTFNRVNDSVGFPYDVVFIDDWRFSNEIRYIKDSELLYKPISIRIDAPDREILLGTPEYDDISEVQLDDFNFDYIVDNRKYSRIPIDVQIHNILKKELSINSTIETEAH